MSRCLTIKVWAKNVKNKKRKTSLKKKEKSRIKEKKDIKWLLKWERLITIILTHYYETYKENHKTKSIQESQEYILKLIFWLHSAHYLFILYAAAYKIKAMTLFWVL